MVLVPNPTIRARVRQSAMIREADGMSHLTFQAMGTTCKISLVEPTRQKANDYLDAVLNWVADFEAKYSRFLETSLVSEINRAAGRDWVVVDPETDQLLGACHDLHFLTQGAFDPTSLPLIQLWNWKTSPVSIPSTEAIQQAREVVGWHKVKRKAGAVFLTRPGMCLDFGGIGKEYAVDRVVMMSEAYGVQHLLVDFGQDIRVRGCPPTKPAWHIGLEDPRKPGTCWGSVALQDRALASSGDYLRHFVHAGRRYGHIIDPRTGSPVNNGLLSTHVIAPSCTIAGILSTTSFVLGHPAGFQLVQGYHGAAGALISSQGMFLTPSFYEFQVR